MKSVVMSTEVSKRCVEVRFPHAQAVFLVGDFNNWSTTATRMHRLAEGLWRAEMPNAKPLGRHGFFLFDKSSPFGRFHPATRAEADERLLSNGKPVDSWDVDYPFPSHLKGANSTESFTG